MTDFRSEVLGESHRIEDFGSGKEPLDSWLREQSRRAQSAGIARTYVWTRPGSPEVLAYYAIAPTQVARADLPRVALAGGYSAVPGYLLARLALTAALHGQGLGGELLLDALGRIVEAARISGGRLIVVDALDEHAHRFYRRYDFIPVNGSNRLYLKVATAEAILAKSSGQTLQWRFTVDPAHPVTVSSRSVLGLSPAGRTSSVQRELAQRGWHRTSIPDVIIAAEHDLTVLHYGGDYERPAEAAKIAHEWIIPRGDAYSRSAGHS